MKGIRYLDCRVPGELSKGPAVEEYSRLKVTSWKPPTLDFSPRMDPPLETSRSKWFESLAAIPPDPPDFFPTVPPGPADPATPLGGRPVGGIPPVTRPPF